MWRAAGDTSTDFNFYTKRAILAGVYSATLMRWFTDDSEDEGATRAFLDRRIDEVMRFEKAQGRCEEADEGLAVARAKFSARQGLAVFGDRRVMWPILRPGRISLLP